jgi:hypothetical protein
MGNCSECGKKLRFFEAHRHPIRGEKYLVCSDCFDVIKKSIEFYNTCLFEGRQNHRKECYFWDSEKKECKNEQYYKKMNKKKKNSKILSSKRRN